MTIRRSIIFAALAASVAVAGCQTMGAQEKEFATLRGGLHAAPGGHAEAHGQSPGASAEPDGVLAPKEGNAYIYADYAGCGCAFVGNEAAFQQYQAIRAANNIAQMQETTAMMNVEAAGDWGGAWGPMVPYWY